MMDIDTLNKVHAEEVKYKKELNKVINSIMSVTNEERKAKRYKEYLPTFKSDDNWLLDAKVF